MSKRGRKATVEELVDSSDVDVEEPEPTPPKKVKLQGKVITAKTSSSKIAASVPRKNSQTKPVVTVKKKTKTKINKNVRSILFKAVYGGLTNFDKPKGQWLHSTD